MGSNRLEAFSDGVLAIIITVMVLQLTVPQEPAVSALAPLAPVIASYVLSFVYIGIYWTKHHHMFQVTQHVDGAVLWANLHLLFWLSLVPFTTAWMGENHFAATPTAAYGVVLLMAAIAYYILQIRIVRLEAGESVLARARAADWKENVPPLLYLAAIPLSFLHPRIAQGLFVIGAIISLVSGKRIERAVPAGEP